MNRFDKAMSRIATAIAGLFVQLIRDEHRGVTERELLFQDVVRRLRGEDVRLGGGSFDNVKRIAEVASTMIATTTATITTNDSSKHATVITSVLNEKVCAILLADNRTQTASHSKTRRAIGLEYFGRLDAFNVFTYILRLLKDAEDK